MNEMPISCMSVIRAVLTHGSYKDTVFECLTSEGYRLEERWYRFVFGTDILHIMKDKPSGHN